MDALIVLDIMVSQQTKLQFIEITHTIIWAMFTGYILAFPVLTWFDEWILTGISASWDVF